MGCRVSIQLLQLITVQVAFRRLGLSAGRGLNPLVISPPPLSWSINTHYKRSRPGMIKMTVLKSTIYVILLPLPLAHGSTAVTSLPPVRRIDPSSWLDWILISIIIIITIDRRRWRTPLAVDIKSAILASNSSSWWDFSWWVGANQN